MRSHLALLGVSAALALSCQHHNGDTDKPAARRAKRMSPADVYREHADAVVRVETPFGDGTGFVVRPDGIVITSHYLLSGERQARVVMGDGRRIDVERVLASDADTDLAVVAIAADGLPALEVADGDALAEGEAVVTIGNGRRTRSPSVTEGVVSTIEKTGGAAISARALAGSAGAPVLDGSGRVVAVIFGAPQQEPSPDGLTPVVPAREIGALLRDLDTTAGETMAEFGARTRPDEPGAAPAMTLDAAGLADCAPPQRERARTELQGAVEIALPVYVIGAHEAAFRVLEGAALRLGRELDGCRSFVDALETAVGEARRQSTPSEGVRVLGELYESAIELLFADDEPVDQDLQS
jgi:S1-C subfamily serine protease